MFHRQSLQILCSHIMLQVANNMGVQLEPIFEQSLKKQCDLFTTECSLRESLKDLVVHILWRIWTRYDIFIPFSQHYTESYWSLQTQERGALRTSESEVVEMVPQDLSALLLRKELSCSQSGGSSKFPLHVHYENQYIMREKDISCFSWHQDKFTGYLESVKGIEYAQIYKMTKSISEGLFGLRIQIQGG